MATCKLKSCRRVKKVSAEDFDMLQCENSGCSQIVHRVCLTSMLSTFGADEQFKKNICGKRCYNAMVKAQHQDHTVQPAKKLIPWHNDGSSSSVSSLSVLIKWMTDGKNYNRYRGGDGQTGETKQTLAGEVVAAIADSGVKTPRSPKDVMSKISGLETSFRVAADWLNTTGQGVQNETDLRAAILHRCPNFYDLQPIMDDSPSTLPLLLNTQPGFVYSDPGSESSSSEYGSADEGCSGPDSVLHAPGNDAERSQPTAASMPSNGKSTTPASNSTARPGNKRGGQLMTIVTGQTRGKNQRTSLVDHPLMISLKETQLAQQKEIELQKLSIQREELLLRQQHSLNEAHESAARIAESNANALKLHEEAEHWRTQRLATLLRERSKLKSEGVFQEEIDMVLPLPLLSPATLGAPANTQGADSGASHHQSQ